jgi:hypothetical protein
MKKWHAAMRVKVNLFLNSEKFEAGAGK